MLNPYQRALNERLRATAVSEPPDPWRHLKTIAIGGFAAAGFSRDEKFLFVITQDGRGVFDLPSGQRVGRDRDSSWIWFDRLELQAKGIPPLPEEPLTVAGIHGGGLPTVTADGWKLERVAPDWPNEFVFLSPPGSSALDPRAEARTFNLGPTADGEAIITYGFSREGRYGVIAFSSGMELFGRVIS